MSDSVNPVFLKNRDIPNSEKERASVLDICLAAERTSGGGTVLGAQDIRGLWRIYPSTKEARNILLIQGLSLRNVMVKVSDRNPFLLHDNGGTEKPSTKVFIGNVPISVANSEIEHSLVNLGCELRSEIKLQRARDNDGKLTRFLTGDRFVFITVPPIPLEKTLKVSIFMASVYHKEQKNVSKTVFCSKCLTPGHHVSQCENDIVCRECKQSGHKRGSPDCLAFGDQNKPTAISKQQPGQNASLSQTGWACSEPETCNKSNVARENAPKVSKNATIDSFVRPSARQTSTRSSTAQRSRSESTKRRRSGDLETQGNTDKQQKCDDCSLTPKDSDREIDPNVIYKT